MLAWSCIWLPIVTNTQLRRQDGFHCNMSTKKRVRRCFETDCWHATHKQQHTQYLPIVPSMGGMLAGGCVRLAIVASKRGTKMVFTATRQQNTCEKVHLYQLRATHFSYLYFASSITVAAYMRSIPGPSTHRSWSSSRGSWMAVNIISCHGLPQHCFTILQWSVFPQ